MVECTRRSRVTLHLPPDDGIMLVFFLSALALNAPAVVDTAPRWAQVSVGADHACALDGDGRAFCWGNNHSLQLGSRTSDHCGILGESGARGCYPTASDTPLAAGGAMRFASISAGRARTCGLTSAGAAYCWGDYVPGAAEACLSGQHCSSHPLPYEPQRRFRTLSVGSRAVCGVTVEGEALCTNLLNGDRWWELGEMRPVRAGRARDVDAVSDWPTRNICMVDDAGAAYCRGSNRTAQTGASPTDLGVEVDSLVRVAGRGDFRRIVMQPGWTCGLDGGGRAWCWGVRSWHEVYDPQTPPPGGCERRACTRTPVAVGGALRFREIGAHRERICGLTATGEAYCWAPATAPASPRDPSADYVVRREQPALRFAALAGSAELGMGSCGITRSGELMCWGGANERAALARIPAPRR